MTDLEKYEKVNSCETVEELEQAIIEIGKELNNTILGRKYCFDSKRMASRCKDVFDGKLNPEVLTRNYGIRQQMFYLIHYKEIDQ